MPNRCTEAICLEASPYRSEQFADLAKAKTPADETSGGIVRQALGNSAFGTMDGQRAPNLTDNAIGG